MDDPLRLFAPDDRDSPARFRQRRVTERVIATWIGFAGAAFLAVSILFPLRTGIDPVSGEVTARVVFGIGSAWLAPIAAALAAIFWRWGRRGYGEHLPFLAAFLITFAVFGVADTSDKGGVTSSGSLALAGVITVWIACAFGLVTARWPRAPKPSDRRCARSQDGRVPERRGLTPVATFVATWPLRPARQGVAESLIRT